MKRIFPLVLLGVLSCNMPMQIRLPGNATPTLIATASPTSVPIVPAAALGTKQNPVVVALPPSSQPGGDVLNAGRVLTSILEQATGYDFVSVIPPSELELARAFAKGNTHIASLTPFGYLLASEQGEAEAAFAREQDGNIFYGAEFLAPNDLNFLNYFDPVQGKNLAEASIALAQFADKKPCWTDPLSPSGYVVPLGFLNEAGVKTREPAFLASHPAVVRALYAGGICDFGATYVGAISYPGLEDGLPEVIKKLTVIWRIPPIIPYETLAFGTAVPVDMRRLLTRTFVDLMQTPEGKSAMQTLYGYGAMQIVEDGQYAEFRKAVKAAGLDLTTLIK